MKNSKYLIYKKQTKDFPAFTVFKVLGKNDNKYTLLGKSKVLSPQTVSLYEINAENIKKDVWVDLDKFVNDCVIINRYFHREKPIIKPSLSGNFYEDTCYTNSNQYSVIAICENMWLCYDHAVKSTFFINTEYIDSDLELDEVDTSNTWSKQNIRNSLISNVENKAKSFYSDLEM